MKSIPTMKLQLITLLFIIISNCWYNPIVVYVLGEDNRSDYNNASSSSSSSSSSCISSNTGSDTTCSAMYTNDTSKEKKLMLNLNYKFPGCRLFLAPSTLKSNTNNDNNDDNDHTGLLGIFTTRQLKRGQSIAFPDVIIQVTDYIVNGSVNQSEGEVGSGGNGDEKIDGQGNKIIGHLIDHYSWDATKFGGHFEGKQVASILPGIGSIANAQRDYKKANALPFRADVDEANVPRTTKPGAGSFTHYHNLTFFATKPLPAGAEILVHYDEKDTWVKNRDIIDYYFDEQQSVSNDSTTSGDLYNIPMRNVDWLTQNGICVDNIKPGQSKVKGAGRGAFATRFIPKGSIIAPVPLVVIPNRNSMLISKQLTKKKKSTISDKQLLLNYCYGHHNSSVLFFPTSPVVNLINHAPTVLKNDDVDDMSSTTKTNYTANAIIQWSTSKFHQGKNWPQTLSIEQLKMVQSGLMMEFVATRDIQPKEEILFDYGAAWSEAWNEHEQSWQPLPNANAYTPSYVMEDVAGLLRNEEEQINHPYASNLEISCFYQYSLHHKKLNDGIVGSSTKNTVSSGEVTTVKWEMDRRTFEFKNLRPCRIMERVKLPNNQWSYKVMIKNSPMLPKEEMIPKGEMHVVTGVPRGAIRFTDKMYTTDQHLPNAFRHEIGIPDEIYPTAWMDL